jgi:hypothetical protein
MLDGPLSEVGMLEGVMRAGLAMFGLPVAFMLIALTFYAIVHRRDEDD